MASSASKPTHVDHRFFLDVIGGPERPATVVESGTRRVYRVYQTCNQQRAPLKVPWGPSGAPRGVAQVSIINAEIPTLPPSCGGLEFKLVSGRQFRGTILMHDAPTARAYDWTFVPKGHCCSGREPAVLWDALYNATSLFLEETWISVVWRLAESHPGLEISSVADAIIAPAITLRVTYTYGSLVPYRTSTSPDWKIAPPSTYKFVEDRYASVLDVHKRSPGSTLLGPPVSSMPRRAEMEMHTWDSPELPEPSDRDKAAATARLASFYSSSSATSPMTGRVAGHLTPRYLGPTTPPAADDA